VWSWWRGGAVAAWSSSRMVPRRPTFVCPIRSCTEQGWEGVKRRAYRGGSHTRARLVPRRPTFVCPIRSCSETKLGSGEEKGVLERFSHAHLFACQGAHLPTLEACLVVCMKWSWGDVEEWWKEKVCVRRTCAVIARLLCANVGRLHARLHASGSGQERGAVVKRRVRNCGVCLPPFTTIHHIIHALFTHCLA